MQFTATQMTMLAQQLTKGRHPIEIGDHYARLNNLGGKEALALRGAATAILNGEDVTALLAEGETWERPEGIPSPQQVTDDYLGRMEKRKRDRARRRGDAP